MIALARLGVVEVLPAPGDDLDLRGDELARDRLRELGITLRRRVAQLLEARHEVERLRVEHREFLLEADRQVLRGREDLLGLVEVDGHWMQWGVARYVR